MTNITKLPDGSAFFVAEIDTNAPRGNPIKWNPGNKVVCDHRTGDIIQPDTEPAARGCAASLDKPVSPSGRCPYCGDRCYTRLWDNLVICDVCCTKYYLFKSCDCRVRPQRSGSATSH